MKRPRKKPATTTYKKVVVKRSGKTKVKSISEKKYEKKQAQAAKRKRKVVKSYSNTDRASGARKTVVRVSKKNDKGRKKSFVKTTTTPASRRTRKAKR